MMQADNQSTGVFIRSIERLGNKLPNPFMLFLYLAIIIVITSAIMAAFNQSVTHPLTEEIMNVKSLLSIDGLHWFITNALENFIAFPPLKLVIVMMLGIGLAERVGLIKAVMRKVLQNVPQSMLTYVVVMSGIVCNLASDAAFVIVPPLAAYAFLSVGRHPIAGLAAGFAGVGAGFTANFIPSGTDALISGITTEAAQAVEPGITVGILANWYFMIASVFLLALVGTYVTDKIISPRLGKYMVPPNQLDNKEEDNNDLLSPLSSKENRALQWTAVVAIFYLIFILWALLPSDGILRDPVNHTIIPSPFLQGIIPILFAFFVLVSCVYGYLTGSLSCSKDVFDLMVDSTRSVSGFIVLAVVISQAIAFFQWSNLGIWIAVNGANGLKELGITGLPLILAFVLLTAALNLLIMSGSAQWSLMAPIIVPMFMLMGFHPALIQVGFRIGDSSTNIISPLNYYIPVILVFMQRYQKDAGLGSLIALMIPYSLSFLFCWSGLLLVWILLGWDVGVGSPVSY